MTKAEAVRIQQHIDQAKWVLESGHSNNPHVKAVNAAETLIELARASHLIESAKIRTPSDW